MDKQQKDFYSQRKPGFKVLLASTLAGAAIAVAVYLAGKSVFGTPVARLWFQQVREGLTVWDLLFVPILLVVVPGIHELGHLVAGLSQKMRFVLLIFGPFQWNASAEGVKFQWVTRLGLMGGIAATMPTQVGSRLRRQLLVMIAGGPVASLVLALAALILLPAADSRVAAGGAFVAVISFGIFLVTSVPIRAGGFMSDGMQLLEVIRGSRSVVERSHLVQVAAQSLAGIRPGRWEQGSVDALANTDFTEPLRQIAAWQLLLYRSLDTGNDHDAGRYEDRLVQHVERFPDGFRQALHVELAICAGIRGDLEGARRHVSFGKGGVVEKSRRLLSEAIVASLEGRREDSQRIVALAGSELRRAMDPGLAALTRTQLDRVGQLEPARGTCPA